MASVYDVLLNKLRTDGGLRVLDGRVSDLENKNVKFEYWEEIASGLSGTIVPPTGSTILLDEYPGDSDAVVSTVSTGTVPDGELAYTAGGVAITCTLTVGGAYVLSGTPASYPVAIVYVAKSPLSLFDYTKEYIGKPLVEASSGGGGIYEVVESRPMTGNTVEIFNVGADDDIQFIFDFALSADGAPNFKLSFDNDSTYPSTHNTWGYQRKEDNSILETSNLSTALSYLGRTNARFFDGYLNVHNILGSVVKVQYESEIKNLTTTQSVGYFVKMSGQNDTLTAGATNIKFEGGTYTSGYIHHLKRNLP